MSARVTELSLAIRLQTVAENLERCEACQDPTTSEHYDNMHRDTLHHLGDEPADWWRALAQDGIARANRRAGGETVIVALAPDDYVRVREMRALGLSDTIRIILKGDTT